MTLDKIIEVVKKDFKGKAVDRYECVYKTVDNKKCAIGLFIPEGHAGQNFSGDAEELLTEFPDLKKYMPSQSIEFLLDFQKIHDNLLDRCESSQKNTLINWLKESYNKKGYHHGK